MAGSFVKRQISVRFGLGTGNFGNSGSTVVNVSGDLRASARITVATNVMPTELHLSLYGLPISILSQISDLNLAAMMQRKNTVTVSAGNVGEALAIVFNGCINQGWVDMSKSPNVSYHCMASVKAFTNLQMIPPTSYPGPTSAATVMAGLAVQINRLFQNYGVTAVLNKPYHPGTPWDQIRRCAEAGQFNWLDDGTTLSIWPYGGSRGGAIPLISPDTGMVGYPSYTGYGIALTTIFNPSITLGGRIQVKSSLPQATGTWVVTDLSHDLESETPNGQWYSHLTAVTTGNPFLPPA